MSLRNYYTLLGVSQSATQEEIRAAFRTLAKKFHPDKAPDNPFADAHFRELQEAYEILSNEDRRAAYDDERWLRGLSNRSTKAVSITPQWLLDEAIRLRKHMSVVDTYHMNHAALKDYVVALLSHEHLSVLQHAPECHERIAAEIFISIAKLRHLYTEDVTKAMLQLAGENDALVNQVNDWRSARIQDAQWNRYRPVIVIACVLVICLLIWWART